MALNFIHMASGRFLDALVEPKDDSMIDFDFNVVLLPRQDNDSQLWDKIKEGNLFRLRQVSSGRFIDAHEIADKDFRVVTRPRQDNNTQLWSMSVVDAHNNFTLRQASSGRFLDAHLSEANDFQVVTRPEKAEFEGQLWAFPGQD